MTRPERIPASAEEERELYPLYKVSEDGLRKTQWRVVRAACGATGVDIGKGLCLFLTGQGIDLGVDKINTAASPDEGQLLPTVDEVAGARAAIAGVHMLGPSAPAVPPSPPATGLSALSDPTMPPSV